MGEISGGNPSSVPRGRLAAHVLRSRWFTVFPTILIMSTAGATYAFAIYSKDIKETLGYDQKTLNTLSFFKDLGANVGIIAGLINEVTPPWFALLIGAVMNLVGYVMIYLAVTQRMPRPHAWQMCLYICIGANSQSFANNGALVTIVKNFPESRGIVLGLMKGYTGLSSAIFTQLYHALYGDDSKSLILLIGWLPAAFCIAGIYTIRLIKPVVRRPNEVPVFYRILYTVLALAGYILVMTIVQKLLPFPRSAYGASAVVVILLLISPLYVLVREEARYYKNKWQNRTKTADAPTPPLAIVVDEQEKEPEPAVLESIPGDKPSRLARFIGVFKAPKRGTDFTIIQALVSIDMWLLFVANVCGFGSSLTAVDNMGQIGESLGYPQRTISTFISLISIWNFAGRIVAGFLSEIFIAKYGFPRPLGMAIVLFMSCVGLLLIAFGVPGTLYVATVIIGFSFGAQMPLLYAIISELFGLKYYATLFNVGAVASPIGSYLFNVRIAGYMYDKEAMIQLKEKGLPPHKSGSLTCIGVKCYRSSFFIISAVTLFAALNSLILAFRSRKYYKTDIYSKFRDASKVEEEGEIGVATIVEADAEAGDGKSSSKLENANDGNRD